MSTILDTDIFAIGRGGKTYKVTFADIKANRVHDTDLFIIGRGNHPYHCTFADLKKLLAKAPVISLLTLADSPQAGRFTSATFASTVSLVEGTPVSTKGIKAWVEGALKSAALTDEIASISPTYCTWSPTDKTPGVAISNGNLTVTGTLGSDRGRATYGPLAGKYYWEITATVAGGRQNHVCLWPNTSALTDDTHRTIYRDDGSFIVGGTFVTPAGASWGAGDVIGVAFDVDANTVEFFRNGVSQRTITNQTLPAGAHFTPAYLLGTGQAQVANFGQSAFKYTLPAGYSVLAKIDLIFATDTGLAQLAAGDALTEVTSTGTAGDATGTVGSVDVTAKTITLAGTAGTWDVGSKVKGPLKTSTVTVTPVSDTITDVSTSTAPTYSATLTGSFPAAGYGPTSLFDGNLTTEIFIGTQFVVGTFTATWSVPGAGIPCTKLELYMPTPGANGKATAQANNAASSGDLSSTGWHSIPVPSTGILTSITMTRTATATGFNTAGFGAVRINGGMLIDGASITTLTLATNKDLTKFAAGDAITQGGGGTASGTVASVDAVAKTMALATSTGAWGPANAGHYVIGPSKTIQQTVKLYCKLNAGLTVTDLQSPDPGYTTVSGTGPYTVTFPATLPSGNAPDTDLPAGTTLTTEVQASNASGTVQKTSNTITPV